MTTDKALKTLAEGLTREQMMKMVSNLAPLLTALDKKNNYPRECPACGTSVWRTKKKRGPTRVYRCRNCTYTRTIEQASTHDG